MRKQTSLTLDERVIERVQEIATNEHRNFSNTVELLVREALAARGGSKMGEVLDFPVPTAVASTGGQNV